MTALALAFVAGLLSILSPCVLPLLPIVLGSALTQNRYGPLALAAGLAISFTVLGLLLAAAGFALGFDISVFRRVAGLLAILLGIVLIAPQLQARLASAGGPLSAWVDGTFGGFNVTGLRGQFALGLLLGAVWSPCVGPTLGAASLLASQGKDLGQVALTMTMFGFGAALPLALLGLLSRSALVSMRERLLSVGAVGKTLLGALLVTIGLGIATGLDKGIETLLVDASPEWLTKLTTRF